ncbi:putative TGF beta receptor associated-like protein [Cryptosporidium felis]|nr:putative TGF beta receptor associated-like protein [Cryptosporidium felis]
MRRFDVVSITSEFSENSGLTITSLCYVPVVGYIYAGTNFGDILLYSYEDLSYFWKSDETENFGFGANKERVRGMERCLRTRNISQKCKSIDKIFPVMAYDTVITEGGESRIHANGVILCICDGNLLYLDFRLQGKITLLCRGVSSISIWRDSYNMNTLQTKFCIATKKRILFYNTCFLGDLQDVQEILKEDKDCLNGKRRSSLSVKIDERKREDVKKEDSGQNYGSGINSWFGFSASKSQKNTHDSKANLTKDSNEDQLRNIEFIKVDEIQIPSRLASFTESISRIEWCDNWVCFIIANTYFIMNLDDQSINEILNLDQLGGNFQPQITILPEQEFMLTCQDNLGAFFSFNTLEPSPKSMVKWPPEGLTGIVLSSPYLLGGTKNGIIQIYSLINYDAPPSKETKGSNETLFSSPSYRGHLNGNHHCVQTLQLDDEITCISAGGTCESLIIRSSAIASAPLGPMVLVSTRTKIYALVPIPIEESIFELVNRNQGKQAINLLKTYCNSNDLLFNSLMYKTQCLVGWFEFKNLHFQKAFNSFKYAHIDPRVLIILFWKDLIPTEWQTQCSNGAERDIYEFAKLPWTNSKGNLSEDLTPDVKFHQSILKSILRKKSIKKVPNSIDSFIQSLILDKQDLHNNFQSNLEDGLNGLEEYIYSANISFKIFLLIERSKYLKTANHSIETEKKQFSTGKIIDIAIIKLIIWEFTSELRKSKDICLSNQMLLSLLNPDLKPKLKEELLLQLEEDSIFSEEYDTKSILGEDIFEHVLTEFEVEEYEDFLEKHGRYDILSILTAYKSSYLKSLEILENIVNSTEKKVLETFTSSGSDCINVFLIIYHVLAHICNSEITPLHIQANLLKRYSRFILDKPDICPVDLLFTLKPVDKFPLTIEEILKLFNPLPINLSNKLTKSYLERIIAQQGNLELKHKVNLIEIYMSDISSMNEENKKEYLNSSYRDLLSGDFRPSKLVCMLEEIEDFDIEKLLKQIHFDESNKFGVHEHIIIEYIIILFRSNKHREALRYIIQTLEDFELAEIYTMAWMFHNIYATPRSQVAESVKEGRSSIEISLGNYEEIKNASLQQRFHRIKLFTEFKFWKDFVRDYSSTACFSQNGSTGIGVDPWLDILDISQNELSLISDEYFNRERNQNCYKLLVEKMSSLKPVKDTGNCSNHTGIVSPSGELVALVSTLIESWKLYNKDSEANLKNAEKLQSYTISILDKYSFHPDLSIPRVLEIIPEDWPLIKIISFLKNSLASSIHTHTNKTISANLSAISYLRLFEKWSTCRSNHITITQDMICNICSFKLGNKQCALYPNGSCVHSHCLSTDQNSFML